MRRYLVKDLQFSAYLSSFESESSQYPASNANWLAPFVVSTSSYLIWTNTHATKLRVMFKFTVHCINSHLNGWITANPYGSKISKYSNFLGSDWAKGYHNCGPNFYLSLRTTKTLLWQEYLHIYYQWEYWYFDPLGASWHYGLRQFNIHHQYDGKSPVKIIEYM